MTPRILGSFTLKVPPFGDFGRLLHHFFLTFLWREAPNFLKIWKNEDQNFTFWKIYGGGAIMGGGHPVYGGAPPPPPPP